jgi:hypothetical protein
MFEFHLKSHLKNLYLLYLFNCLITLAGLPTAKELSGISFVTTDPAPITQPLPIVIRTYNGITTYPTIITNRDGKAF